MSFGFSASVEAAISQAPSIDLASAALSASERRSRRRLRPRTRWVSSVQAQKRPPTPPSSSGNRAVGVGEECFLGETVPLHDELELLVPGRPPLAHHQLGLRTDRVPDLGPDLPSGAPEGRRVAVAQDRGVGVVVDVDQCVAPPDEHRVARIEHDPDRGLQAGRPPFGGAQRSLRPVVVPDPALHLPGLGPEVRSRRT